jgi:hypothetical protein
MLRVCGWEGNRLSGFRHRMTFRDNVETPKAFGVEISFVCATTPGQIAA